MRTIDVGQKEQNRHCKEWGSIYKDRKEQPVKRCLEKRAGGLLGGPGYRGAKPRSLDLVLDQRHRQRSFLWREEGQQIGS